MKNPSMEKLTRLQRQHQRNHPWNLTKEGLWIKTCYDERKDDDLSWWDDVGFVLNKRKVIVWWQHPRMIYADEIRDRAFKLAKPYELDKGFFFGGTPNYRKIGKSRKKIVSYTCDPFSENDRNYFDELHKIENDLKESGIEFEVTPSWQRERLHWATGITLIAPLEVRNETELGAVADLARQLLLGQTTLKQEFPNYKYTKTDWLFELN